VFGEKSAHFTHYSKFAYDGQRNHLQDVGEIIPIIGVLEGALDDLTKGFLARQEFIISAALFDDLLDQARHLNAKGYEDPAAVLARVVLEDALRKIAREAAIDDSGPASAVNDRLKKAERLNQPQWRQVQSWLDTGNAAAHGDFDKFTQADAARMIDGLGPFLANEFR
jgi:hypothetical protein